MLLKKKEKAYSDNKKYKHEVISINFLFVPTLILGLAFMPFYYQEFLPSYAVSYSEWSLQSRVDSIGDNSSGLREILFLTLPTLLILCSSIHIVFTEKYNIFYRLLFILILFSYTYTQFLSGSRYSVIVVLLMISIFINYRIRKFTALEIVLGGVFVYILINLLSLLRATSDPIEMFYLLTEEIGLSGLSFLSLQSSGELLTGLNAVRIIEGIDSGEINFKYGTLFFNQILNFIPQVIWAGRPEVASVLYVQTFYPGVYESGGGFGFSVVAEGYWEAGLAGCLFYGFMTGLVSEKIFQMFLRRKGSDVYIFLYALIFSRLVISLNRSGLIAALKSSLIIAVPILLIIIIYKIYIIFGKK